MYKCKYVNGHFEVYFNNSFLCSADTLEEAHHEIEEHARFKEGVQNNQ